MEDINLHSALDPIRNHMRDVYNLELSDHQLELILNVAAQSIVAIDHVENYDDRIIEERKEDNFPLSIDPINYL